MANAIEERGQFWWFEETGQTSSLEQAVHGLLTISEEGLITLQLEGPLYLENSDVSWEWDASRWLPNDKRILGRLGKSGDAGWILLQGLYRTDFSFIGEPARQSYEANLCFKHENGFPSNFNADEFHTLRIELKGLEDWLKLQAIDVGEEVWHGSGREFTVKHDRIEISYETDRAIISIENIVLGNSPIRLFHGKVSEVRIWQTNWLVYQPKVQFDLTRFQVAFRQAEEFIALLTGRHFSLEWPNLVAKFGEWDEWFELYWARGHRNETAPSTFFMLIEFPAVRDDFGKMFDRLQTGAETYGPGYSLYAASMQQPLPYPEHEFINLVWSIESLHRGWERERPDVSTIERRKKRIETVLSRFVESSDKKLRDWLAGRIKYAFEPTLEDRIFDSFQRLPFDLDAGQLRVFAQRCAKRRNDISHEGGQRPGENAEDFRRELRTLAEALRYLFHGLLLHEIGLKRELLLKAFTSGGIGTRNIVPALQAVGIDLTVIPNAEA